jgi:ABC-type bacteriocin/lantibiotic exporter with double-glycine peptidase domain
MTRTAERPTFANLPKPVGDVLAKVYDVLAFVFIIAFIALVTMVAVLLIPIALVAMLLSWSLAERHRRKRAKEERRPQGWIIEGVAKER